MKSHAFNRRAFEESFRDFVAHTKILTKNEGLAAIKLYTAQEYALDQILTGLSKDIHYFVIYKARQLGITTLTLLLDLFWCGLFPGLQGGIVTDTDPNKEKLRLLVEEILDNLPPSHPLPIAKHNRNGIVFRAPASGQPGSMIDYLVAGTKKRTGSLGRSRALNFCHMTEMAQYGDAEGVESLKSAFSHRYPSRLYVIESTAHGYNLFHDEWEDAIADDLTKGAIFIPWWMHDDYMEEAGSPIYQRYGYADLSDDEKETQAYAKSVGYAISREQWAWYRHRKDPQRRSDSGEIDEGKSEIIEVEYPGHPEEGFRMSGSPFLPGRQLDLSMQAASKQKFKAYCYYFGDRFEALRRDPVNIARLAQLKIWQEPVPHGRYIVSADPAYGSGDTADRYCIQVLRVYADRMVQVAEFCTTACEPFQFTWVLADVCGWYGNCRWILEVQGPGAAVMTEFRHLQTLLASGQLRMPGQAYGDEPEGVDPLTGQPKKRAPSPLANVTTYLYHRPDALSGSFNIHWQTSHVTKPPMMTAFGDYFLMGKLIVNSVQAHVEMKTLVRKGLSIEADGNKKDDRPIALAMGVRCWIDWERAELESAGRTFEAETERDRAETDGAGGGYMSYLMSAHFKRKDQERKEQVRRNRKSAWNW